MGVQTIITDDLTGKTIEGATEADAIEVTFNGVDHKVFLSDDSAQTVAAFLSGEAPLLKAVDDATASKATLKRHYDALEDKYNDVRAAADVLVSHFTGDENVPEAVEDFIKAYKKVGTVEKPAAAPKPPAGEAATRVRLTGDAKARFDKATADYTTAKAKQRASIFKFAATTEAHKDAKDSGKNISVALLNDYYDKNPDETRYYGTDKVQPPSNKDYA